MSNFEKHNELVGEIADTCHSETFKQKLTKILQLFKTLRQKLINAFPNFHLLETLAKFVLTRFSFKILSNI